MVLLSCRLQGLSYDEFLSATDVDALWQVVGIGHADALQVVDCLVFFNRDGRHGRY